LSRPEFVEDPVVPLYEYKCAKCANRFEKIEPLSAPTTQKCPKCGGKAERQLNAPAIQFKGSGWYVTDYAGKNAGAEPKAEGGETKAGDSSSAEPSKKPAPKDSPSKSKKK
jgi:putative FmdB family regulatory protein